MPILYTYCTSIIVPLLRRVSMREVPVNLWFILLAAVAQMVVGFLWYSPLLFGNLWMKLMGHTKASLEKAKQDMARTYGLSFVSALVMAYVLRHASVFAAEYFGQQGISVGLSTAFWMWLGFVMPVQFTAVLFNKEPYKLFLLNTGF